MHIERVYAEGWIHISNFIHFILSYVIMKSNSHDTDSLINQPRITLPCNPFLVMMPIF